MYTVGTGRVLAHQLHSSSGLLFMSEASRRERGWGPGGDAGGRVNLWGRRRWGMVQPAALRRLVLRRGVSVGAWCAGPPRPLPTRSSGVHGAGSAAHRQRESALPRGWQARRGTGPCSVVTTRKGPCGEGGVDGEGAGLWRRWASRSSALTAGRPRCPRPSDSCP